MSIYFDGYVCLGENRNCHLDQKETPHDALVGLYYDLDPNRVGSGQIYYKLLNSYTFEFKSTKACLNIHNPEFEPSEIFMITYDRVLSTNLKTDSRFSFQIFVSTDLLKNSIVSFKYTLCPTDINLKGTSGLNYKKYDGTLKIVKIDDDQQCTGSNVNQKGVWISDVTNYTSSGKNTCYDSKKDYIINNDINF